MKPGWTEGSWSSYRQWIRARVTVRAGAPKVGARAGPLDQRDTHDSAALLHAYAHKMPALCTERRHPLMQEVAMVVTVTVAVLLAVLPIANCTHELF